MSRGLKLEFEPCLPVAVAKVPLGSQWVHEIKHDGYRLIIKRDGEKVRLLTRRGFDWTDRFPRIVAGALRLKTMRFTIDAEAVWCGDDGIADFEKLRAFRNHPEVFAYAFDAARPRLGLRRPALAHQMRRLRPPTRCVAGR